MGCHLFSIMINGLLHLQWPDQGVFTSSVLWLLGFTPSVGLNMGLNMGLTPSVVWIWASPHQFGLNMGFTPSVVWIWFLPHQWYIFLGFTPYVVCLKGFTPTMFWFISWDVTPNEEYWVFVLRCRATSFLDLPNLVSMVLPLYYPMSFIHVHSFMHIQHAYKYHSCIVALSDLFSKSIIHNVSKSEMLPIMYISSGRSHQNSRLPMSLHFPSVSPV